MDKNDVKICDYGEMFVSFQPYNVIRFYKKPDIVKTDLPGIPVGSWIKEIHCNKTSAGFMSFLPIDWFGIYQGMFYEYALFLPNTLRLADLEYFYWATYWDKKKLRLFIVIKSNACRVIECDQIVFHNPTEEEERVFRTLLESEYKPPPEQLILFDF